MTQKQTGWYYDELAFVKVEDWPFSHDDRAVGLKKANKLAPGDAVWMYNENGEPGYYLLKPESWEDFEARQ